MTDLNIKDLRFETHEIGQYIKSTKAIFIWEFILDDKRNKIELQHSRVKGKRTIILNGSELTSGWQYTYSYSHSFPMDKHYMTIIQMTPELYDLRIDNMSFHTLLNRQKMNIPNKPGGTANYLGWSVDKNINSNSKRDDNKNVDTFFLGAGNENDFDFSDKGNRNQQAFEFDKNIINDFDFEDDTGMKMSNPIAIKQQIQMKNKNKKEENNDLLDLGISNANTNSTNNNNPNNNQDLFNVFGNNSSDNHTTNTTKTNDNNNNNDWNFCQQPNQQQSSQPELFDFNSNQANQPQRNINMFNF